MNLREEWLSWTLIILGIMGTVFLVYYIQAPNVTVSEVDR